MLETILYFILYLLCLAVVHVALKHWRFCLMIISRLTAAFFLWSVFFIAMEMQKNDSFSTIYKAYNANKHHFSL